MKNAAHWVLRVGVAGEFIGHGMFALQGKAQWSGWIVKMLSVTEANANSILQFIGGFDIVTGIIVLLVPIPAILLWAAAWGFWTALVRPLVGESGWDFVERWANWAAPLALLLMNWPKKSLRAWFTPIKTK
ncbi:MAG: hypothetical protein AAB932_06275 [Patescibacteria group bacterium]